MFWHSICTSELAKEVLRMETTKMTLAEIAVTHPAASRVFHGHGLDYCCGGQRSLDEACRERQLDAAAVLRQIQEQESSRGESPDWSTRPLDQLTRFIIEHYHEPLRNELPELVALAEKVERRHADKDSCPSGLAAHLRAVHEAVLMHLEKEEQVLFPMIAGGSGSHAGGPIHVMEDEHHEHAHNLRRTRELAHDLVPPEEACTSWRALYLRLEELEAELMEHIHLENNVLFRRALCE
jgi:regulator of cell morphogenesis and NO signaling